MSANSTDLIIFCVLSSILRLSTKFGYNELQSIASGLTGLKLIIIIVLLKIKKKKSICFNKLTIRYNDPLLDSNEHVDDNIFFEAMI